MGGQSALSLGLSPGTELTAPPSQSCISSLRNCEECRVSHLISGLLSQQPELRQVAVCQQNVSVDAES